MADDNNEALGFAGLTDIDDEVNVDHFVIKHLLSRVRTGFHGKVIAVYPGTYTDQGFSTPTTVDVQPVVKQQDAQGNTVSHATVYGLAVPRIQHGTTGVFSDPAVGDVGFVSVADRDSSSMIANNGQESSPGSSRRNDMADGVYWGTLFGPKPTNFIDLRGGNISVTTPGNLTHTATGNMTMSCQGQFSLGAGSGDDVIVKPTAGKKVYLGGDPANGGVFGAVSTTSGPSDNVFAHVSGPV